jgi:FAD/FMN-containing dehydrogenase
MPGDEKPVLVVEDTAADVHDLPAYIADFNKLLTSHGLYSAHYAHAGSGEIHLRPIINLKTVRGTRCSGPSQPNCRTGKYQGSPSGEHGDGLRGEFITDGG